MSATPEAGPREALRSLGANLAALLRIRGELFSLELKEELRRQKELLWLATVSGLFLAAGFIAAAILVVVVFWDTYRIAASASVTGAYLCVGGWALLRLRDRVSNGPAPFSGTIAELERDMDMIRGSE
jgi:uncharacterized membrane protein YqjE